MTALDTNILIYAHRPEMPFHAAAKELMQHLAESESGWAIPWPCVHEFLAVVTHPRVFVEPTTMPDALLQVAFWMASPSIKLLCEPAHYYPVLQGLAERGAIVGPRIHDARIIAICIANGADSLFSADRDFSRFSGALTVKNPFVS